MTIMTFCVCRVNGSCRLLEGLLKLSSHCTRQVGISSAFSSRPTFRTMIYRLLCYEDQCICFRVGASLNHAYDHDKFLFISVAPLVRGLVCTSHALRFDCHSIATSGIFFISPMHQVCAGGQEIVRLSYKKADPMWRHVPDVIPYGGILQGILQNSTVYAGVVELPSGSIGGLHSVESH